MMLLLVILSGLLIGDLLGYAIHAFLHWEKSGSLYRKHMTHHQTLYPVSDFYSAVYRSPGADSTIIPFAIFIACGGLLMFLTLPWLVAGIWLVEFIVLGLLNNYFHDTFHISPHWLEKYGWFKKLRKLHYIHHLGNMKRNYGIFSFLFDKVFGTYIPR